MFSRGPLPETASAVVFFEFLLEHAGWGKQSTDEMGSMSLFVVAADETELPELQQAYRDHRRGRAREAMFSGTLPAAVLGGR